MRTFIGIFAVIGLLTSVLFAVIVIVGIRHLHPKTPGIPSSVYLTLDLTKNYPEAAPSEGLASLVEERAGTFRELTGTIRRAALDDRVKGLVAKVGEGSLGVAKIEELRDAITFFRQHKKMTYAYAESFGELSSGTAPYFLATAFDQIWLQPIGSVGLVGVSLETPFLRGLLDKAGVTADFSRRGEFKSAETELTETKLPATDRVAFDGLAHSIYDQIVEGIAAGRHIDPALARQLIDSGPYTGSDALARHLVDRIGYSDEIEQQIRSGNADVTLLDLPSYSRAISTMHESGSVVALVYATGIVGSGKNGAGAMGAQAGSDDLSKALAEASKRRDVKAIVLRIDSPGGSDVASEAIWRATQLARREGKPLVVSMGDEAASGGYYIACGADRIVAEPGTLTGSIGVFGGKFVLAGLWDKIGVTWDGIAYGQNAAIGSTNATFTPEQRQHFEAMLDESYRTFKARVAQGRHLDPAKVDAIARGRVWTGIQARDLGLVDSLGGLKEAVDQARTLAHIGADQQTSLETFPKQQSVFQTLMKSLSGSGSLPAPFNATFMEQIDRAGRIAGMLEAMSGSNGTAMMRPLEIAR